MTGLKQLLTAASMLALSGCGYLSFAPPDVSLSRRIPAQQLSSQCQLPLQRTAAGSGDDAHDAITPNVDGALALIDNFIDAYRCTMRVAADGRQAFQLPGFLALTGAAAATALGGGPRWGITGGAASAMFTAGNGYYSPQEQAAILRDATEALTCIQTEAVGVSAFSRMPRADPAVTHAQTNAAAAAAQNADSAVQAEQRNVSQRQSEADRAASELRQAEAGVQALETGNQNSHPAAMAVDSAAVRSARAALARQQDALASTRSMLTTAQAALAVAEQRRESAYQNLADAQVAEAISLIEVTPERQYFNLITAALLGVEVAAAQRLSRRGTFDAEGVRAQITALTAQAEKGEVNVRNQPTPTPATPPAPPGPAASQAERAAFIDQAATDARNRIAPIQVRLDALQPRLQQCILRAEV